MPALGSALKPMARQILDPVFAGVVGQHADGDPALEVARLDEGGAERAAVGARHGPGDRRGVAGDAGHGHNDRAQRHSFHDTHGCSSPIE
jgi:hypothetical protein